MSFCVLAHYDQYYSRFLNFSKLLTKKYFFEISQKICFKKYENISLLHYRYALCSLCPNLFSTCLSVLV